LNAFSHTAPIAPENDQLRQQGYIITILRDGVE